MTYGDITLSGTPSRGLVYAKLCEHLREAQECAIMMGHLHNTEGNDADKLMAKGWLGIGELIHRMVAQVTALAANKLQ